MWHHEHYVTHEELQDAIDSLNERISLVEASQQAQIDAEVAAVQALGPKLDTIKSEIDALKAQPAAAALDFTALDAAIASVGSQVDTDVAEAAPPAPPAPITT